MSPTFKQSSLGSLDSLSAGMFAKKEIAATRRRDKSSRTNDGDHILSTRFRREKVEIFQKINRFVLKMSEKNLPFHRTLLICFCSESRLDICERNNFCQPQV